MFTSGIDDHVTAAKTALWYLIFALLCALFGAVYEIFSHEVYSYFMIYAFVFPLLGGTLPFLLLSLKQLKRFPCLPTRYLYHFGISTLTVGSIIQGVLDIYGTTNSLVEYYWKGGVGFLLISVIVHILATPKS